MDENSSGVETPPQEIILAATFRQARLTAEIDWEWRRVGPTEFETDDGARARIVTNCDQLRGLRGVPRVHLASDFDDLPRRDRDILHDLVASGRATLGRRA